VKYFHWIIIGMLMIVVTLGGDTMCREGQSGEKSGTSGGVTSRALKQTAITTEVAMAGSFLAERVNLANFHIMNGSVLGENVSTCGRVVLRSPMCTRPAPAAVCRRNS
jgi:hypothetical protein